MHRSVLLIIALLACACTRHETGETAASTINGETTPGSEMAPRDTAASTPLAPPKAKRNLLRLPPEYKEAQTLYRDARQALEAGDKDSANELLDRALALRPEHALAVRDKLALCRAEGKHEEALLVASQALEKSPRNVTFGYEKALTLFEMEKTNESLTTLAEILDPEKPFPAARLLQMKALATLKDTEATFAALEAAAAAGFTDTAMIAKEPVLQALSGDPRFQIALDAMERTKGRIPSEQQHPVMRDIAVGSMPTAKLVLQVRSNKATGSGWTFDLDLKDVDQKRVRSEDYRGKPLILCAWGTWSVSSWKILPHLVQLKELYKENALEVLLLGWENHVDYDFAASMAKDMLRDRKIDLRSAVLVKESFNKIYLQGFPGLFFVNPEGKVETYTVGYMPLEDLKTLTEAFLGKGEG